MNISKFALSNYWKIEIKKRIALTDNGFYFSTNEKVGNEVYGTHPYRYNYGIYDRELYFYDFNTQQSYLIFDDQPIVARSTIFEVFSGDKDQDGIEETYLMFSSNDESYNSSGNRNIDTAM